MYDDLFDVFVKYMATVAHANNGTTFVKSLRKTLTEDECGYIDAVSSTFYDQEKEHLDKIQESIGDQNV